MSGASSVILYHPAFLEHNAGVGHPECAERLLAVLSHLAKWKLFPDIPILAPEPARPEEIARVHGRDYILRIEEFCSYGGGILDSGDTIVSAGSYRAAVLAAGAGVTAVNLIQDGAAARIFCMVRPPGHHAESDRAMGFCIFNNAAVCAHYWLDRLPRRRVAIVDWDVHHGNGTQNAFYESPEVLYISLHEYPLYPGTGFPEETGSGEGRGFTLNVQIDPGTGDDAYLAIFRSKVLPAIRDFKPEGIIISAGFDAHHADPLANLNLSEDAYGIMTKELSAIADEYAHGRIISFLEGGYNLGFLPVCIEKHLRALSDDGRGER